MIWLLVLVAVCSVGGCVMIIGSDEVAVNQTGVKLDSEIKTKKGDTAVVPPED